MRDRIRCAARPYVPEHPQVHIHHIVREWKWFPLISSFFKAKKTHTHTVKPFQTYSENSELYGKGGSWFTIDARQVCFSRNACSIVRVIISSQAVCKIFVSVSRSPFCECEPNPCYFPMLFTCSHLICD